MKLSRSLLITLLSFGILTSCLSSFKCVEGEGPSVKTTINTESFSKIHLKNGIELFLTQGDAFEVVAEGSKNLIDLINTKVDDNTWVVEYDKCVEDDNVKLYVTLPRLSEVKVYGSGSVHHQAGTFNTKNMEVEIYGSGDIQLNVNAQKLVTGVKGSGDIDLTGTAVNLEVDIAGSGSVKSDELKTQNASVDIKGSGDVKLDVANELNIEIKGSGDIYYKDEPVKITSDIKGSGSINKL